VKDASGTPRRHREQELRALEGTWQFVTLEIDGSVVPASMASEARILIDGDRFRTESPQGNYEGVFTIDVEAVPARIDIEFVEGPEAGNWSYGIYRLDQDELTICLGVVGASRPGTFDTRPGSGHALEKLRRASAARPANVKGGRVQPARQPVDSAPVDEAAFALAMTPLLERLQGEWTPVALVSDGKALPKKMLDYGSRTMRGNETKVVFGGQVMLHAKVRLDESQQPIAVDYLNLGRGPRAVTLGILDIHQDVVRFCMAAAGQPRPADFTCEPGSGRTFSEWRRRQ
jgi:uncharacterized protein (TIGR03067 family)